MLETYLLPALILLVSVIALFIELYRKSNLRGRPRHVYRHVPEHMRQQGGVNVGGKQGVNWR